MQRTDSLDSDTDSVHDCTVVLDNGSATLRAGFGSSDRPSLIMPSLVGRPQLADPSGTATPGKSKSADGGEDELLFGDDVLAQRETLKQSYPVCWGLVQNWEDLTKMWNYVFEQKLGCKTEESPLVVMESAYMVPKIHREKMTELAFETFNVPAFYLARAPAAVLIAMEKDTGLVVDVGRDVVRVVPVYEGYCLPHAVMKFEIGSQNVTSSLNRLLTQKGVSLIPFFELRQMKEKLAYVAQDYEQEKATFNKSQEKTYTLSNGDVLTLGQELFQCAELLFQPSLQGTEVPGLADHVVMTISKCSPDIRQPLLSNVVLVGGGSMVPGLATRLQHDVVKSLRGHDQPDLQGLRVQVLAPPEGDLAVWQGGSCIARNPVFAKICISKEEYDECGPVIVHKKCY